MGGLALTDVEAAAGLLALAVSYRHSVARHEKGCGVDDLEEDLNREVDFIATSLRAVSSQAR
jgi:hypothetical protein